MDYTEVDPPNAILDELLESTFKNEPNDFMDVDEVRHSNTEDTSNFKDLELSSWICESTSAPGSSKTSNKTVIKDFDSDSSDSAKFSNQEYKETFDRSIIDKLIKGYESDSSDSVKFVSLECKKSIIDNINKDFDSDDSMEFNNPVSENNLKKECNHNASDLNSNEIQKQKIPNDEATTSFFNQGNSKENPNSQVLEEEEIPLITIKDPNSERARKFRMHAEPENSKILPLAIIDIKVSDVATENPYLYWYKTTLYKFVKIVGTVIERWKYSENKVYLKVDDGTGILTCVMTKNEDDINIRREISDDLKYLKQTRKPVLDEDTFDELITSDIRNKLAKMGSGHIMNTLAKDMLQRIEKQFERFPRMDDIEAGDTVSIVGKVTNLKERLLFVLKLRKESSIGPLIQHLESVLEKKKAIELENNYSDKYPGQKLK